MTAREQTHGKEREPHGKPDPWSALDPARFSRKQIVTFLVAILVVLPGDAQIRAVGTQQVHSLGLASELRVL
jgi:hypothetical protein